MSDIFAVLLIPEEGDPHGLLREGTPVYIHAGRMKGYAGVYLPDKIRAGWGYVVSYADHEWRMLRVQPGEVGLRLGWKGKVIADGMDHCARVVGMTQPTLGRGIRSAVLRARHASRRGYGVIVLHDADGNGTDDV